ncbi:MAG TPA: hypothetical protein PLI51_00415 [bacterium]|nr:hypothetical protein [bacterium]HPQ65174.1 hypothetical protein [bacterium]
MSTGKLGSLSYFCLLFAALLAVFLPTFSNPPRSDFWPLLHHFQQFQSLPSWDRALNVVNYDICGHGTYRPLFHVFLYWMHLFSGADYFRFHAAVFAVYCLNIALLYRLARKFGSGRSISLAFLTVFAFLFSHFDIVAWTFHIGILIGFGLFLLGFSAYLSYLRARGVIRLTAAAALFLAGLLCYEIFILWPAGAIFLLLSRRGELLKRGWLRAAAVSTAAALAAVFILYGALVSLARSHSSVAGLASAPPDFFSPSSLSFSLAVSTAGIAAEGLAAVDPFLVSPGLIHDNIGRGGVLLEVSPLLPYMKRPGNGSAASPLILPREVAPERIWLENEPAIDAVLAIAGFLVILAAAAAAFASWKKRGVIVSTPVAFALFLLVTETFVLYHGRMATNPPIYILSEFRYQYVTDALLILLGILGCGRMLGALPRIRLPLYSLLAAILLANLAVLIPHLSAIERQLAPLHRMLSNIRTGLEDGRITPEHPLYLDDAIARELPRLCWNRNLAGFTSGSYQWIFSPAALASFACERPQASWVVERRDLSVVPAE